ncbi:MlaD family protein [Williamsia serinedens]|uniref:Phospholipid/cholesterol/gamma-HCH transport system substrate-binding protein n=1 Tax=Williamsia serinedens TaxID=391736 RepID=A0ABT1H125_9NOCA|nr:MlaD family protein [Williamsia serinedens]MCP2160674.1 phospholipid/cholesterol/gamma-HCH transport system substrate-binding protein [Williamsia serinedens]
MTDTTAPPTSSRWRTVAARTVIVAAIVAVIAMVVAAVRTTDSSPSGSGCAIMSDSIGLYPGSNLTLLGVTIGHVTRVGPDNGAVRVDFDVDGGVRLPATVSAVTTSDSIVTDRRLEIPTPYTGGPTWDTSRCIPLDRTRTPKSLSQAFDAFNRLSSQLTDVAGRTPGQQQAVGNALADVDDALRGSAEDFNRAVQGLSRALGDPALRDSQLRSLIVDGQQLAQFFVDRWPDVQSAIDNVGKFSIALGELTRELNPALERVTRVVPQLATTVQRYGPILLKVLELITPLVELLPTDQIVALLRLLPPVMSAIRAQAQDTQPGLAVSVAAPTVRVRAPMSASAASCAVVNRLLAGSCRPVAGAPDRVDTRLLELVLGSAGRR